MEDNISLDKNRKYKKKLLSFLLQTISLLIAILGAFFVFHFAYEHTNKDLQNNSIVGMNLVGQRIYSDGTATQEHLKIVNDFFDNIKPEIKQKYINQNWLIILADTAPTTLLTKTISFTSSNYDHAVYSKLGGLTVPDGKIIYLNTKTDTYDDFSENLAHEFGHCIDYFAGYPSYSDKNTETYQLYSVNDVFFNDYESSNITEFFASAYKEYILFPEQTKENMPELYMLMEETEKFIISTNKFFVNTPGFIRLLIYNIKGMTGQI